MPTVAKLADEGPEMVADELLGWAEEGDIDGFNLISVVLPQSWDDVVELLVPELQKRGVYWSDYAVPGGILRENLYMKSGHPHLDDAHPGSTFKWNATVLQADIMVPFQKKKEVVVNSKAKEEINEGGAWSEIQIGIGTLALAINIAFSKRTSKAEGKH